MAEVEREIAKECVESFQQAMEESLVNNNKPVISSLTMLAEDYADYAELIATSIVDRAQKVKPQYKLPAMYLIDSIMKSITESKSYKVAFEKQIVSCFCAVFYKVDEKIRESLFKLRQTWNGVFSAETLNELDISVKRMDPAWPIIENRRLELTSRKVHINPKFLNADVPSNSRGQAPIATATKQTESVDENDEATLRKILMEKQQELKNLKEKKIEMDLADIQSKLNKIDDSKKPSSDVIHKESQKKKDSNDSKHVEEEDAIFKNKSSQEKTSIRSNKIYDDNIESKHNTPIHIDEHLKDTIDIKRRRLSPDAENNVGNHNKSYRQPKQNINRKRSRDDRNEFNLKQRNERIDVRKLPRIPRRPIDDNDRNRYPPQHGGHFNRSQREKFKFQRNINQQQRDDFFQHQNERGWQKFKEDRPQNFNSPMQLRRVGSENVLPLKNALLPNPMRHSHLNSDAAEVMWLAEQKLADGIITHQEHQDIVNRVNQYMYDENNHRRHFQSNFDERHNRHPSYPMYDLRTIDNYRSPYDQRNSDNVNENQNIARHHRNNINFQQHNYDEMQHQIIKPLIPPFINKNSPVHTENYSPKPDDNINSPKELEFNVNDNKPNVLQQILGSIGKSIPTTSIPTIPTSANSIISGVSENTNVIPKPSLPMPDIKAILDGLKGFIPKSEKIEPCTPTVVTPAAPGKDTIIFPKNLNTDCKLEAIADMTSFKSSVLKTKQLGIIQRIYQGIQCSTCGIRFPETEKDIYASHLDLHFQRNLTSKNRSKIKRFRKLYPNMIEWIRFEHFKDDDSDDDIQGTASSSKVKISSAVGTKYPAASSIDDENICVVCSERFEQFYNEEQEEWLLKDALLVNGKLYHPICYEDRLDAPAELTEANDSIKLNTIKTEVM